MLAGNHKGEEEDQLSEIENKKGKKEDDGY